MQDHAPLQRNPLRAERVHRCRRVSHAEGDAEQQLELRGDIQELADGVGVDAEYGLRDAGQPRAASESRKFCAYMPMSPAVRTPSPSAGMNRSAAWGAP